MKVLESCGDVMAIFDLKRYLPEDLKAMPIGRKTQKKGPQKHRCLLYSPHVKSEIQWFVEESSSLGPVNVLCLKKQKFPQKPFELQYNPAVLYQIDSTKPRETDSVTHLELFEVLDKAALEVPRPRRLHCSVDQPLAACHAMEVVLLHVCVGRKRVPCRVGTGRGHGVVRLRACGRPTVGGRKVPLIVFSKKLFDRPSGVCLMRDRTTLHRVRHACTLASRR